MHRGLYSEGFAAEALGEQDVSAVPARLGFHRFDPFFRGHEYVLCKILLIINQPAHFCGFNQRITENAEFAVPSFSLREFVPCELVSITRRTALRFFGNAGSAVSAFDDYLCFSAAGEPNQESGHGGLFWVDDLRTVRTFGKDGKLPLFGLIVN